MNNNDCAIANKIDKRNWQSVNHIPGIHDNGPRDHGVWRLTLTAYRLSDKDKILVYNQDYNWRAHFQNLINPLLMKIEFLLINIIVQNYIRASNRVKFRSR